MLIKVAMLAGTLALAPPAFADKASKTTQSTNQTRAPSKPPATSPKSGKPPLTHTIEITSGAISPATQYAPKK